MEKPRFISSSLIRHLLSSVTLVVLVTLLSSCAPVPGGAPSVALSEQLQEIRRQQQQQSEQLQLLSRQMVLLQEVMGIEEMKLDESDPVEALIFSATPPADGSAPPRTVPQIELNPAVSAYLDAFSHLASGRPDSAERGFEFFLQQFPDHQHSANARYWLAQAQSTQGKNDLATTTLRRIISDPRAEFKAPAALMQLAAIYRRQGLNTQADNIVEQLRSSYPDSPEAQLLIRNDASQTDSDLNSRQRGN